MMSETAWNEEMRISLEGMAEVLDFHNCKTNDRCPKCRRTQALLDLLEMDFPKKPRAPVVTRTLSADETMDLIEHRR